ncbi:MAG: SCP2 sterol-binding domain-containing protein [Candidatus Thorarchaeota archaeon]
MKILTKEWLDAFGDAINNNQAYKDAASWWEGDMLCVIEPSGPLDHEVRFYLGLYHGDCTGVKLLEPGEVVHPEFTLAGPYDNWVKIAKKQLDTIQAVMSGKLRLEGNLAKLMRATRAAQEIVNSLQKVETEFL